MTTATKHEAMGYITKGALYSNLAVDGLTSLNTVVLPNNQYETPVSTDTITINDTTNVVIIDPAASLAFLTIVMPGRPKDGKTVRITITQSIAVLVHTASGTDTLLIPFPSYVAAGSSSWYYRMTDTSWYPTSAPLLLSTPSDTNITTTISTLEPEHSGHYYLTSSTLSYTIVLPVPSAWWFSFTMTATANTNTITIWAGATATLNGTVMMPTTPFVFVNNLALRFEATAPVGSTVMLESNSEFVRVTGASSVTGSITNVLT